MSIMERRRENHDPERSEEALQRLSKRDDKIGRLCRMMLEKDDCETLDDQEGDR